MAIKNRYEFMYYVACTNCNPNGDPDMGNMPRMDPQTMQGFITDAATKRRIRNYVELAHRDEPGMGISRESFRDFLCRALRLAL